MGFTIRRVHEVRHNSLFVRQLIESRAYRGADASHCVLAAEQAIGTLSRQRQSDQPHTCRRGTTESLSLPGAVIVLTIEDEARRRLVVEEIVKQVELEFQKKSALRGSKRFSLTGCRGGNNWGDTLRVPRRR